MNAPVTILGIETSCDETSAAVMRNGILLSNIVSSQFVHEQYGGVVPELASRAHQKLMIPIVQEALLKAGVGQDELSAVAGVIGPGLMGSLLVGLNFGKSFAYGLKIPFIGVNHMEAHIYSNFIEEPSPAFPFLCLTVSGGHTELVLVRGDFNYEVVGQTRDDAAGEAFDKVAKMLDLGYPGGPKVDALAKKGNAAAIDFPRSFLDDDPFGFSFSGIKTSVLYYLRDHGEVLPDRLADICASFQASIVEVLVGKTMAAAQKFGINDVAMAGGVSANSGLRRSMIDAASHAGVRLFMPKLEYCTDNGAMIAAVGHRKFLHGLFSSIAESAVAALGLTAQSTN
ncbi:MAG TPA: tRNA (adenosine(37)-N6)-threonylcarbamoyltransferase complex transferase subunit TsaD [Bacteroidota bacterium]|nr:tRNA (adenosine(37)-N6)-threonylcarbamoyltransferase complex transferase subunit TsaD [Bacteroidota bacterium]